MVGSGAVPAPERRPVHIGYVHWFVSVKVEERVVVSEDIRTSVVMVV